jgi:PAS domain S-box-containing protein
LVLGAVFSFVGSVVGKLHGLKQSLEERVQERTEELQASEEELRQNMENLQAVQEEIRQQHDSLLDAHEQEREANEIFRVLFEHSTDPHMIFGDGGIIDCNEATIKLLGYESKEAILHIHPASLSPEYQPDGRTSAEKGMELDALARKIGFMRFEWTHQKANGEVFPVEVILNHVKIRGKDALLVVWHDLTEVKQQQTVLEQRNIALSNALKELKEAQSQLIHAEKMVSLGQLVASVAHEINTPLGAIRSSVEHVIGSLSENLAQFPTFILSLGENEREIFTHLVAQVAAQKILSFSSKEARKLRMRLAAELEERGIGEAYELAECLEEMGMQDLNSVENALDSPSAGKIITMAHRFAILQRSAQNIRAATENASKVIFALKNFSRQDQTGEKVATNINESIETVLVLYQNKLKHGIEVAKNFASLPQIPCYQDEIVQVWTNLVHNAVQAMGGSGTLSIETVVEQGFIRVDIGDTGQGIPENVRERVFDAFFTTKKVGEGSGLGLNIAQKIVDKHAGKIWFETEAGKGTIFHVTLPIE